MVGISSRVDKPDNVHSLGGLDLYFRDVIRFYYRVTIGLVLIALRDLIVCDNLAALLAALVITDRTEIVSVQLIELNLLAGLNGAIDSDWY